jgi:hypothetical protein
LRPRPWAHSAKMERDIKRLSCVICVGQSSKEKRGRILTITTPETGTVRSLACRVDHRRSRGGMLL